MIKSILCTTLVLFLAYHVGRAQVVVNSDGSHSVVTGNVIVNPDGSHSVLTGNVIVNSNGTHAVKVGNVIVNSNGTHSVITGNVLVNPDGSHSMIPLALKSDDAAKPSSAPRSRYRELGDFENWFSKLFGKGRTGDRDLDTLNKSQDTLSLGKN
jgi:hypothetical protein